MIASVCKTKRKLSAMVDESFDISVTQVLAVTVRLFFFFLDERKLDVNGLLDTVVFL